MAYLVTGIVLFAGLHLFAILFPGRRDRIKRQFGEKQWKMIYALVSLAGLGLMIYGFLQSRSGPLAADLLYIPGDWTRHAAMLLVLLAFIALAASHGKGHLALWLKQPMSLGILLWSGAHLLANGKRSDVYFFGAFFVVALADIVFATARGKVRSHQPVVRSDIIAIVAGLVLYFVFLLGFHPYVLNLPVTG